MSLYLVAVPEDNIQSPLSLYDYDDLIGDVFELGEQDPNIIEYFREKYKAYAGEGVSMSENSIVLMTEDDTYELAEKYPADENVSNLIAAFFSANETFPCCGFYFTFQ